MIDGYIESGELNDGWFKQLTTSNERDYIIDNELYSVYRNGVDIISIPEWNEPSKDDYERFSSNFRYNLPRVYTLYKLNGDKNSKYILPYMKWKYKMKDMEYEKLQRQYNKFVKVLEITNVEKIKYEPPFENIESRTIEEVINGQIMTREGYSSVEYKQLEENKEYIKSYKKLKKKIISASIVYERSLLNEIENTDDEFKKKELENRIKSITIRKDDNSNLKRINEILQSLKIYFNQRYLIKERRYLILNKESGRNSLFYQDKEYNFLSLNYYDKKNPDYLKQMRIIERDYMNKGMAKLKEKQNNKKISYGITWLQDKRKITNKDLSGKTGLSIPTVRKYRKINWKDDNQKLF